MAHTPSLHLSRRTTSRAFAVKVVMAGEVADGGTAASH